MTAVKTDCLNFLHLLPPQYKSQGLVVVDQFGRVEIAKEGILLMRDPPSSFAVWRRIMVTQEAICLEVFGSHWARWPFQIVGGRYIVDTTLQPSLI